MRRAAASLDLGGSGQAVLFARKACNIPQGAPADFVRSALVASFTLAVSWQSPQLRQHIRRAGRMALGDTQDRERGEEGFSQPLSVLGFTPHATTAQPNGYLTEMLDIQYQYALERSCETKKLVEVSEILSGGTPSTRIDEYWQNGSIPFFAPGDVTNSIYTMITEKHITESGLANCNSALYPTDTVFLTARGTVGKVAMAGVPMAMNQSCFAFAGIGIPQTVVFQIIKRAVYSLKTKAIGAVFAAINTRDLKLEEVDIPNSSVMADYDAFARPIHALIKANEEEALRLAELRGALLPKLMSGEIDVSEVDLTQLNSHLA